MPASSPAASWVVFAPPDVSFAACATDVMFSVTCDSPIAASDTFRAISRVVAVCSSTALAMVVEMSCICAMMPLMSSITVTASRVPV